MSYVCALWSALTYLDTHPVTKQCTQADGSDSHCLSPCGNSDGSVLIWSSTHDSFFPVLYEVSVRVHGEHRSLGRRICHMPTASYLVTQGFTNLNAGFKHVTAQMNPHGLAIGYPQQHMHGGPQQQQRPQQQHPHYHPHQPQQVIPAI